MVIHGDQSTYFYKEDVIMLREEKLKRILGNETIEE